MSALAQDVQCCKMGCLDRDDVNVSLKEWMDDDHTQDENHRELFKQVRSAVKKRGLCEKLRLRFSYFGKDVCRCAFCELWHCSKKIISSYVTHAENGYNEMPQDLRKCRHVRGPSELKNAAATADLFWQYMYNHIAENLAEGYAGTYPPSRPGSPGLGPGSSVTLVVLVVLVAGSRVHGPSPGPRVRAQVPGPRTWTRVPGPGPQARTP